MCRFIKETVASSTWRNDSHNFNQCRGAEHGPAAGARVPSSSLRLCAPGGPTVALAGDTAFPSVQIGNPPCPEVVSKPHTSHGGCDTAIRDLGSQRGPRGPAVTSRRPACTLPGALDVVRVREEQRAVPRCTAPPLRTPRPSAAPPPPLLRRPRPLRLLRNSAFSSSSTQTQLQPTAVLPGPAGRLRLPVISTPALSTTVATNRVLTNKLSRI